MNPAASAAGAVGLICQKGNGHSMAADEKDPNPLCLVNATVLTGDPDRPGAEAVGLIGSCIAAIGTEVEVRAFCGPQARVLDCEGGTVLPGFIDAHVHMLALASSLSGVDLSPEQVGSVEALCRRLRDVAKVSPEGAWIRGHGYDEFFLRERRHPTRRELDEAAPGCRVRLRHRTRHASVLNSAALRHIGERAPHLLEAPGAERDPSSGELTGVLYDLEAALTKILPRLAPQEMRSGLARASDLLLAAGVTAVDDASANNGTEEVGLLREAAGGRLVHQHVRCLWGMESHGLPNDRSITAVKLTLDERGSEVAEFRRAVMEAHCRGLQIAVHAVEGPAIAVAVDALESALQSWPRPHRHRLEHCALCPPPLADRIAELGLAVVVQPGFLRRVGERYIAEVPVSEQNWLYPLRSLAVRGVVLAGSSDAPVGSLAPLVGIAAAVGRRTAGGRVVNPAEALDLDSALGLYGRGAAHVTHADRTRGWLATGRVADLVVLKQDLTRVHSDSLGESPVACVVVGGQPLVRGDVSRPLRDAG